MIRISGKLSEVVWPYFAIGTVAGLVGYLTFGIIGAVVAVSIAGLFGFATYIYRGNHLYEAFHDDGTLIFTNKIRTLRTGWNNVRSVRTFGGEDEWYAEYTFIQPVSGKTRVLAVGSLSIYDRRETEIAAAMLIEKFKQPNQAPEPTSPVRDFGYD